VPPRPVSREPEPSADGPRPAPAPTAGPVAATGAASPVLPWAQLPQAFRAALPPMAFGGAMDSPVAEGRMLIINGQIFREGEEPAPGLRLDRIRLRSAEMSYRGQRFEIPY